MFNWRLKVESNIEKYKLDLKQLSIPTSSKTAFAKKLAKIYISFIKELKEPNTGNLKNIGPLDEFNLRMSIQKVCNNNIQSNKKVDFLEQIGPIFLNFWAGTIITGNNGITIINNPGKWTKRQVHENLNPNIFIENFEKNSIEQLNTIGGEFINLKLEKTSWTNFLTHEQTTVK